jgi:hypothetical protein
MACVSMYIASNYGVDISDIFLMTAYNKNYKQGFFSSTYMTFGHSWALLGTDRDGMVVDPWGGVVCKAQDYKKDLKAKLDKWFIQGKRISVNWSDGKSAWMNANDEAVLSLLQNDADIQKIRGDQKGKQ